MSLFMTCISVLLVLASLVLIKFSGMLEKRIKDKVAVNVFLKEGISEENLTLLKEKIEKLSYVKSSSFVSREEAEKAFLKETGEDFKEVLEYNPLPESFVLRLKDEYVTPDSLNKISRRLGSLAGIDEVVYESQTIYEALNSLKALKKYVFSAALVLVLISFYIVYSTNRLVVNSKRLQMETMKLVGARLSLVRLPIVINGVMIGLLASCVSFGLFRLFNWWLLRYAGMPDFGLAGDFFLNAAILSSGPLIGLAAGVCAVQKITLKVQKILF
ncbi:MAG TPA: permease-like cell division protein FtsX [Ignavibacteriales bacterium]|nr:permease-like cell division protein FtsX [Ignavibacteriales bacterium]